MKRIYTIFLAFILAFIAVELIVSKIFHYPRAYSRTTYRIKNELKEHKTIRVREPYCKILVTEGEPKIFEFSNIGLPGPDIDTNYKDGYIFLLGNSYIEAMQVRKEDQTATKLQEYLKNNNSTNQVINLGVSAGDPYILWFRANFFDKSYNPQFVVLVIESLKRADLYLSRYETLDFSIPNYFGEIVSESFIYKISYPFRKKSTFINLITRALTEEGTGEEKRSNIKKATQNNETTNIPSKLTQCLKMFKEKYGDKFLFISIINQEKENLMLQEECQKYKIKFMFNMNIVKPENMINGAGHLNERGNDELAKFIREII